MSGLSVRLVSSVVTTFANNVVSIHQGCRIIINNTGCDASIFCAGDASFVVLCNPEKIGYYSWMITLDRHDINECILFSCTTPNFPWYALCNFRL